MSTSSDSARTEVLNFAAGPAKLPDDVLTKAQAEFMNWGGTGMSIMGVLISLHCRYFVLKSNTIPLPSYGSTTWSF